MALGNVFTALGRAAAIRCFELAAQFPGLASLAPTSKLRGLLKVAALPDLKYEGIFSQSVYAPWLSDAEFVRVFAQARQQTLVDEYRCFELWMLVPQLSHLPPGDILEVGVWQGGTGCLLASRAAAAGWQSTVYLCDTFTGVAHAGENDPNYVGGEHADTSKEVVLSLAAKLGLKNVSILQGIFPDDTAKDVEGRTFRLCHIDVDTYESARLTFDWVWPRLVPGGVVVFDDYGFYSCAGVTRLVNQMIGLPDRLVIYNVNGHAVVIKQAATV